MIIRKAIRKDIERILPIRMEVHKYHVDLDAVYEPVTDLKKSFKSQTQSFIKEKECIVLIAEENNDLIGYAQGKLKAHHSLFSIPKSGVIDEIGVVSKERNKGIGEQLVNELIKWFKANDAGIIDVKVHNKNVLGTEFWSKMGFTCFVKEMHKEV